MTEIALIAIVCLALGASCVAIIGVARASAHVARGQAMLVGDTSKLMLSVEEILRKNNSALISAVRMAQEEMLQYARGVHIRNTLSGGGIGAVTGRSVHDQLEKDIKELCRALDLSRDQAVAWIRTQVQDEAPRPRQEQHGQART